MHKQHTTSTMRAVLVRTAWSLALGTASLGAQAGDATTADAPRQPPLAGRVLADDELNGRRGGAATQNDMRLDGVVGSNEATNTVSGANTISSGAFAGSAGLPMVIQNSGSNVLIQNATIVNVQIK